MEWSAVQCSAMEWNEVVWSLVGWTGKGMVFLTWDGNRNGVGWGGQYKPRGGGVGRGWRGVSISQWGSDMHDPIANEWFLEVV